MYALLLTDQLKTGCYPVADVKAECCRTYCGKKYYDIQDANIVDEAIYQDLMAQPPNEYQK